MINTKIKSLSAGILWIICCFSVFSQNPIVLEYQAKSDLYSCLYSGQIKREYSIVFYANHPYYKSADFTDATLVYDGNVLPGQKIRMDLYTNEIIVKLPEEHYNIIVESEKVDTIFAWGETIIRLVPPEKSGLSKGFYSLLFDGRQSQMLYKERFSFSEVINNHSVNRIFSSSDRYYFHFNEKYYPVKNKNSFIKLFPQYKKQINRFSKERALDFMEKPNQSFTLLAGYCEELLQSEQKP